MMKLDVLGEQGIVIQHLLHKKNLMKKNKKKRGKEEEVEDDDNNPWICCDECHRWLRAKDDNIDDISIYDDANPDHLDYYCPKCRKKKT